MDYDDLLLRLSNYGPTGSYDSERAEAWHAVTALQERVEELEVGLVKWAERAERAESDLAAAREERDKWHQAYQSMLDPFVRAKMLEPAPPMIAPVGMAEQVLLHERDKLKADLAAARALLRDAKKYVPAQLGNAILSALAGKDAP